ncbi:Wzz/FepE/Etk N-terminal domain-containing protein [Pseudocolwellia sp. AS88]|uniref:Wzz/FepE/Etk N-terminal domain-containing protein n=1 Tax=Pseudocolwellia sp. AS88 TaxID=3063958 RepID=UPI0026E9AB34|nr:Wzz/FepE/Etk N-terminal domain-containing protein [Pseudocolwellia sp. AS88]MDO7085022.1 Wzz/FepE/Etk N-terminal domain-containing protein [Pseudocolwellia sp. AS88]
MSQEYNSPQVEDDEIDLAELWRAIWAGKFIIIAITFVFAVASVFYALSKPDVYKASVLLSPVSSQSGSGGLGALAGQFGGLASLAGINLGSGGGDQTSIALATLESRSFIENFIKKHDLLVPLMAAKKWNKITDTLILNEELYDEASQKWIREVKPPQTPEPTPWEAYTEFKKILTVSQDKENSLITLELEFFSPTLSKAWLVLFVKDINEFVRNQEKEETQESIAYLKNELENIQVANMETVFYQLIEEQTKTMMLAQVKKEYVFKTIDPAQVPDKKSGPKRALIVVLGAMLGGILSVLFVLIRYFKNN